jgi:hypothetical protein
MACVILVLQIQIVINAIPQIRLHAFLVNQDIFYQIIQCAVRAPRLALHAKVLKFVLAALTVSLFQLFQIILQFLNAKPANFHV